MPDYRVHSRFMTTNAVWGARWISVSSARRATLIGLVRREFGTAACVLRLEGAARFGVLRVRARFLFSVVDRGSVFVVRDGGDWAVCRCIE